MSKWKGLGMFDQERYKKITLNDERGTFAGHLSPASTDGLANNAEAVLSFYHLPSENDIFFKAFITTFNESYASDWGAETVFGRTDPIYTLKNNTRRITLGWKIPADSISEGYENLGKLQRLAQFLYPTYANVGGAEVLSQSPLIRLKIMNLIRKTDDEPPEANEAVDGTSPLQLFTQYTSTNNPRDGLLGVITSMNINHNLENPAAGVLQIQQNTILPKLIEVTMDFSVIHESTLGWTADKVSLFKDVSFPYGAPLESLSDPRFADMSYDEKIEARKAAEEERVLAEQDLDNAKARNYDGLFGKKRLKKDQKRLAKIVAKHQSGKGISEREGRNYQYLNSAQRGYLGQGYSEAADRQAKVDEATADQIAEFISD